MPQLPGLSLPEKKKGILMQEKKRGSVYATKRWILEAAQGCGVTVNLNSHPKGTAAKLWVIRNMRRQ